LSKEILWVRKMQFWYLCRKMSDLILKGFRLKEQIPNQNFLFFQKPNAFSLKCFFEHVECSLYNVKNFQSSEFFMKKLSFF